MQLLYSLNTFSSHPHISYFFFPFSRILLVSPPYAKVACIQYEYFKSFPHTLALENINFNIYIYIYRCNKKVMFEWSSVHRISVWANFACHERTRSHVTNEVDVYHSLTYMATICTVRMSLRESISEY